MHRRISVLTNREKLSRQLLVLGGISLTALPSISVVTIVYLANPNDVSATVTFTYTNKSGTDSTPYVVTIPANGSAEIPTSTIGNSTSIKGGYVTISLTQGVTAFALYNNLKTGNYSYAGINAFDLSK